MFSWRKTMTQSLQSPAAHLFYLLQCTPICSPPSLWKWQWFLLALSFRITVNPHCLTVSLLTSKTDRITMNIENIEDIMQKFQNISWKLKIWISQFLNCDNYATCLIFCKPIEEMRILTCFNFFHSPTTLQYFWNCLGSSI